MQAQPQIILLQLELNSEIVVTQIDIFSTYDCSLCNSLGVSSTRHDIHLNFVCSLLDNLLGFKCLGWVSGILW